jgi:hypothetical protein
MHGGIALDGINEEVLGTKKENQAERNQSRR